MKVKPDRRLIWDDLANLCDEKHFGRRPARIHEMISIFRWAKKQLCIYMDKEGYLYFKGEDNEI